jgi:hypothetical protein
MVFLFSNIFFFLRSLALRARSAAAEEIPYFGVACNFTNKPIYIDCPDLDVQTG